jgi:Na+/melibiose symporter-like transporter
MLTVSLQTVEVVTYVLQVVSGVILVLGVLSTNRFFKESGAQDTLNINMLLLHAGAFGLYLITAVLICLGSAATIMFPFNQMVLVSYEWTLVAVNIGSFISQVCLCLIFWDLGREVHSRTYTQSSQQSSI